MALTSAQLLDLLDAVIEDRLNADAYVEYSEAAVNRFRGMEPAELLKWREYYAAKVAAEGGGGVGAPAFFLAEPFDR